MAAGSLSDRLEAQIREVDPIPVSTYIEAALYDEHDGFYATQGRAGRRGDFLTAPEVGPLFGAAVAGALDQWWGELGRPNPFPVWEWGAGPGTLVRAVLAAEPEVVTSGALRWVAVERSAAQRASHLEHELVESVAEPGEASLDRAGAGIVLANELLDNLPFDIFERSGGGWAPMSIDGRDGSGRFTTVLGEPAAVPDLERVAATTPDGARIPRQEAARRWLAEALAMIDQGRVVVFDYGASTATLADRDGGWLRTHRAHDGSAHWLTDPGSCDITSDVAFDQLQLDHRATAEQSQAAWLALHGIEELVEEGRRVWEASAGVGDLAALKARSRIRESEALLDPDGMGAFRVLEWIV